MRTGIYLPILIYISKSSKCRDLAPKRRVGDPIRHPAVIPPEVFG